MIDDSYARAFDALAAGNVPEPARRGERAGLIVATLLCRADLSPYRIEQQGRRWQTERLYLAHAEAIRGFGPSPDERAEHVELGLLYGCAALVLRTCGPTWPQGVAPVAVAWALVRVMTA